MDPLANISTRNTPQTERADARQTANRGGGYSFTVSDRERLKRFLTLGTEGGTFYAGERELTKEAAGVVFRMAETDHEHLVLTIIDVSVRGAAPKPNPALFALAVASSVGKPEERALALAALPGVARTGTHLFTFAGYVEQFRGWGRSLRTAVAGWYTDTEFDRLAYQVVKYRQRGGWTHRDLLRLSHPKTDEAHRAAIFDWVTHGKVGEDTPTMIRAYLKANEDGEPMSNIAALVREFRLSWEMLPTAALSERVVWEALVDNEMPLGALVRQLPRLTRLGVLKGDRLGEVVRRLSDQDELRRARIHPMNLLVAQRTYASGESLRGDTTWTPVRRIVDALDEGFYLSFGNVEPAGKRTLLALDVSGSMGWSSIGGLPITPREASAALALVQMSTEPEVEVVGFTGGARGPYAYHRTPSVEPLTISPRQRLDDAVRAISNLPFGPTDCSLPMEYALENGLEIDTFVIYTDSETNGGRSHPYQALRRYREKTGINAKMIVVGMTATDCSIADPSDPGMLDVAGFDVSVPGMITEFSRGI